MEDLYSAIFKRKSIRTFDSNIKISDELLQEIENKVTQLVSLDKQIKTVIKVIKKEETNAKTGEYCLALYSEQKDNYLINAGYLLEQMDLFFASRNIGCCWYGFGRAIEKKVDNLPFVIMTYFGQSSLEDYQNNHRKRMEVAQIYKDEQFKELIEVVGLAPSACNSQPWRFESTDNELLVYRSKKIKSALLRTAQLKDKFNSLDMGIVLYILEIVLEKQGYQFERELVKSEWQDSLLLIARYKLGYNG